MSAQVGNKMLPNEPWGPSRSDFVLLFFFFLLCFRPVNNLKQNAKEHKIVLFFTLRYNYIQLWPLDYEKPIKTLWCYSLHIVHLVYDSETLLQRKGREPEVYVVLLFYTLKNTGLNTTPTLGEIWTNPATGLFWPSIWVTLLTQPSGSKQLDSWVCPYFTQHWVVFNPAFFRV